MDCGKNHLSSLHSVAIGFQLILLVKTLNSRQDFYPAFDAQKKVPLLELHRMRPARNCRFDWFTFFVHGVKLQLNLAARSIK